MVNTKNLALSKQLVKFVCFFIDFSTFKTCFEYAWTNLPKLLSHETAILFEILGCSLWRPSSNDEVIVNDKISDALYEPMNLEKSVFVIKTNDFRAFLYCRESGRYF